MEAAMAEDFNIQGRPDIGPIQGPSQQSSKMTSPVGKLPSLETVGNELEENKPTEISGGVKDAVENLQHSLSEGAVSLSKQSSLPLVALSKNIGLEAKIVANSPDPTIGKMAIAALALAILNRKQSERE
jgi:hypothetical protein